MLVKILLRYFMGYVRVIVEGYYIERFINICSTNKVLIWNLKREKGIELHLNVGIQDFYKAVKIAKKTQCKIKIEKRKGIPFLINKYKKRKIFLIALIIIIASICISSNYVWNIEIQTEDNAQLTDIEKNLQEAGLKIGMRKEQVNTEEIVNKIRLKRADISWIGINLKGTNAIVKIVKAKEAPSIIDEKEYSNIIAKKSGTITNIIAQNGTAQVKNGDYVDKGQILIKGEMEGKYTGIRYVHSLGEVKAIVEYSKTERISLKEEEKVKTGKKETKYEINFNKFQINLYKTLSKFEIYDTIEEEKKLRIFSNLYLPISVKKITNEEVVEEEKIHTVEEATESSTKRLEGQIENEIEEKQHVIRKKSKCKQSRRLYRSNCNI